MKNNIGLQRGIIRFIASNPKELDVGKFFRKNGVGIDTGKISDGYHTFDDLYNQRLHLSAALVNAYPSMSYKTKYDQNGKPWFGGGWFLVGISTSEGDFSYHYELKDWDMFHCVELAMAPEWDGHTSKDVTRLDSIAEDCNDPWVDTEIEFAEVEAMAEDDDGMGEYVVACLQSAKRALQSLMRDGHSGMSINVTKQLLCRLIDRKNLTALTGCDEEWEVCDWTIGRDVIEYQNKRYSGLFKEVNRKDGSVSYHDVNQFAFSEGDGVTFHCGWMADILRPSHPISMPYYPSDKPIYVEVEQFLLDKTHGDFDHVCMKELVELDGTKKVINRYFAENDAGKMVEIDEGTYNRHKADRVDKDGEPQVLSND